MVSFDFLLGALNNYTLKYPDNQAFTLEAEQRK